MQLFATRTNYVDQIRFISVLTVRRRNWRPILRPHLCGEENFIVFGRSSALSGRLLGVRPWISKRGFWDFPPLLAMKQSWTFPFPRPIIQRPNIWLLWAPQWLAKPWLRSFPLLLAIKRRWTLFAFPRRIIQRPIEMTGRAVPVVIPVKLRAKA